MSKQLQPSLSEEGINALGKLWEETKSFIEPDSVELPEISIPDCLSCKHKGYCSIYCTALDNPSFVYEAKL